MSKLLQSVDQAELPVAEVMSQTRKKPFLAYFLPMGLAAVVLGVGVGFLVSERMASLPGPEGSAQTEVAQSAGKKSGEGGVSAGMVFGDKDASAFPDTAEGVLVAGGKDGEGSHHLLREGGESQNVYLTSSAVNLDQFINHKVTVRGQTNSAQKAGWLLDVGQVRVEALNAPLPAWAQKQAEKMNGKDN